jgi:alginate O-acetyltransferase complex protein AlgI
MLTMLIGGLWHGASWTFVVWGGLHGIYLIIEKLIIKANFNIPLPKFLFALVTFFFVLITWVFFRAKSFVEAWMMLVSIFSFSSKGVVVLSYLSIIKVFTVMSLTLIGHWYMRDKRVIDIFSRNPIWQTIAMWTSMLVLLILSQESTSSFIYFQF